MFGYGAVEAFERSGNGKNYLKYLSYNRQPENENHENIDIKFLSRDLANWILYLSKKRLSHLELQRILFLIDHQYKKEFNKSIFVDTYIIKGKLSPIYDDVYHIYKTYGSNNIDIPKSEDLEELDDSFKLWLSKEVETLSAINYWDLTQMVNKILEDKNEIKETETVNQSTDNLKAKYKDNINPTHYKSGKVECIDALESATVNKEGIEAVCVANVIKYLWRYESKGGIEDCKKAKWYLDKLINHLEEKGY